MVALLVALSIAALMMTVAMPTWKTMAQREKEDELVFRGQQYARAIGLFERMYANAPPPSIDVLLQQRFLRKKYKDPMTRDDFQLVLAGQATPGAAIPGAATPGGPTQGAGPTAGNGAPTGQPGQAGVAGAVGGIVGVTSKSKDASLRVYNGRTHYNEWLFTYALATQTPGIGAGGPGGTGRGGRGNGTNTPGGGQGGFGGGSNSGPGR